MKVKEFVKDILETITINRIYNYRQFKNKAKTFNLIISKNDIVKNLNLKRIRENNYKAIIENITNNSKYTVSRQKDDIIIKVHPFDFKTPISMQELNLLNQISYK